MNVIAGAYVSSAAGGVYPYTAMSCIPRGAPPVRIPLATCRCRHQARTHQPREPVGIARVPLYAGSVPCEMFARPLLLLTELRLLLR